jgi:hypothetical protein
VSGCIGFQAVIAAVDRALETEPAAAGYVPEPIL